MLSNNKIETDEEEIDLSTLTADEILIECFNRFIKGRKRFNRNIYDTIRKVVSDNIDNKSNSEFVKSIIGTWQNIYPKGTCNSSLSSKNSVIMAEISLFVKNNAE